MHSSISPNLANKFRTLSSLWFFESIPTKSLVSSSFESTSVIDSVLLLLLLLLFVDTILAVAEEVDELLLFALATLGTGVRLLLLFKFRKIPES